VRKYSFYINKSAQRELDALGDTLFARVDRKSDAGGTSARGLRAKPRKHTACPYFKKALAVSQYFCRVGTTARSSKTLYWERSILVRIPLYTSEAICTANRP
jgi:hypothetical protein